MHQLPHGRGEYSTPKGVSFLRLLKYLFALTVIAGFCVGGVEGCQSEGGKHSQAFSSAGLLTANSKQLHATVVSAHLETPLADDKNVLWCGSFQLAWNEACTLAGGHLKFAGPESETVTILNRKSFDAGELDSDSNGTSIRRNFMAHNELNIT